MKYESMFDNLVKNYRSILNEPEYSTDLPDNRLSHRCYVAAISISLMQKAQREVSQIEPPSEWDTLRKELEEKCNKIRTKKGEEPIDFSRYHRT